MYKKNIEKETLKNKDYRRVVSTTVQTQLVLMNIPKGEQIGMEKHNSTTQFIRVEKGKGHAIVEGRRFALKDGDALVIPANTPHNIVASKSENLLLYTLYSPPEHEEGLIQKYNPLRTASE